MARSKYRRYKADYAKLFDDPFALFGENVKVTIWPNGDPAIWITDRRGLTGIEIKASAGSAGAGLQIRAFVGTPDLSVSAINLREKADLPEEARYFDATHLEITQHYSDPYSQAFKQWYRSDRLGDGSKAAPYPADLGLTPIEAKDR